MARESWVSGSVFLMELIQSKGSHIKCHPPQPQSCLTTDYLPAEWLHVICSRALLLDHHLQICIYLVGLFGGLGDLHINQNDFWKVKGAQRMFTIWAIITDLCPVIEKLVDYWSPRTSWRLGKASSFWNSLACPFTVIQVPAGGKWEDLTLAWGKVKSCPKSWAGKHLEDMRDHVGS